MRFVAGVDPMRSVLTVISSFRNRPDGDTHEIRTIYRAVYMAAPHVSNKTARKKLTLWGFCGRGTML